MRYHRQRPGSPPESQNRFSGCEASQRAGTEAPDGRKGRKKQNSHDHEGKVLVGDRERIPALGCVLCEHTDDAQAGEQPDADSGEGHRNTGVDQHPPRPALIQADG